ncbi:MAG: phosphoribosyltransferase [Oscillospiraceae bacterium]
MENRAFTVTSAKNKLITMNVIPGHFTNSTSHLTHYLDMSRLKFNALIARDIAREMAVPYLSNHLVETIVCMEEMDVIGAYLAEELIENGMIINSERDIHVLTPRINVNGQLIFQQSTERFIHNKHVILLVASAASGKTIDRTLDCLKYYNGELVGISAIFTAAPKVSGHKIHALFNSQDIYGYKVYRPSQCVMCQKGQKLEAMIGYDGYTRF